MSESSASYILDRIFEGVRNGSFSYTSVRVNIDRSGLQMKYSPYSDGLAFKQLILEKLLHRNFPDEENSTDVGLIG